MAYASTYRDSTGRTARPGGVVGRADGYIVHTEAGAPLPATATLAQERARVRAIDLYHRSLGWAGAGYAALSCASGRVHEMRGWFRAGAHTVGHNDRPAICQAGHGDRTELTTIQVAGIRRWADDGVAAGALTVDHQVTGHRDHIAPGAKSCPGNLVYPQLAQLRPAHRPPTAVAPTPPAVDVLEDDMLVSIDNSKTVYHVVGNALVPLHDPVQAEVIGGPGWQQRVKKLTSAQAGVFYVAAVHRDQGRPNGRRVGPVETADRIQQGLSSTESTPLGLGRWSGPVARALRAAGFKLEDYEKP
jgi:hypothetical protein